MKAGFVLCLALLLPGALHAQTAWKQDFKRVEVADGIVAFVANESPGGVVQGNITLISGSQHSLVIDSGQYPSLARRVIELIDASGAPPVRWLVNTHWHGDHLLANVAFEQAYPELIVIQHAETARLGAKEYADWQTESLPRLRTLPESLEKQLAEGRTSDGKPLDDAAKESMRINLMLVRQLLPTALETRWDAPDVTFADTLTLDLGGRRVALRNLGKANTTGDIVAWDEKTKTLVTGDIVVSPTPYSFGSYHSEWIDVLAAMRTLQPAHIVPGHGEVMRDDDYLRQLATLLEETRTQVRAAIAQNRTLEQMKQEITLPAQQRLFAGDDPNRIRAFRSFYLAPGIEQAYKEAKGEPRSE